MKKLFAIIPVLFVLLSSAQYEHEVTGYVWPEDEKVLQKLDEWQDLKFGLLMHWGSYSQWGIVESWSICPEDYGWCERKKGSNPDDYFTYKKEYENLKLSFNPVNFNPEKWEKFVEFTHNQIMELMTDYGKVDILWLDGGWVAEKPASVIEQSYAAKAEGTPSGFIKNRTVNQDIRMDELAAKAREKQPGLIVVDRAVRGPNQNYLTPENRVPETQLPYPWESCIIAGGGWSWVPNPQFMTPKQAIHMLVDIVAKGGNLLYNIGPGPDGTWPEEAYTLLAAMGDWINVNGEAIYSTRAIEPYKTNNICLTQKKDTKEVFAIYLETDSEHLTESEKLTGGLPESFTVKGIFAANNAKLNLLGTKGNLKWENTTEGVKIYIPEKIWKNPPCVLAWAVKISEIQ